MAVGFPTKVTYPNGDVFNASDINDTNGTINLINPSAKGDLFAGSAANTYGKLSVGTDGQVLTAASGQSTGLQWQTPVSGGMTLLSTTTLSGAATTISGISASYNDLYIVIHSMTNTTADGNFTVDVNNTTTGNYTSGVGSTNATVDAWRIDNNNSTIRLNGANTMTRANNANEFILRIYNYASSRAKLLNYQGYFTTATSTLRYIFGEGWCNQTSAVSSLVLSNSGGNNTNGTCLIYGVK